MINVRNTQHALHHPWLARLNGTGHAPALWLYMLVVFGHWVEHVAQVYQVYILGWAIPDAGGALGLWFPGLIQSELLHFVYNFSLLGGLVLLRPGFSGSSRRWWNGALLAQTWHFFEHVLLLGQVLTGVYLFGATKQISIGQLWIPRVELHFLYNLIVFLPMVVALVLYFSANRQTGAPAK